MPCRKRKPEHMPGGGFSRSEIHLPRVHTRGGAERERDGGAMRPVPGSSRHTEKEWRVSRETACLGVARPRGPRAENLAAGIERVGGGPRTPKAP